MAPKNKQLSAAEKAEIMGEGFSLAHQQEAQELLDVVEDAPALTHGVDDGVERIADNAVDPMDSRVDELGHDLFRDVHAISLKLLAVTLSNHHRHD